MRAAGKLAIVDKDAFVVGWSSLFMFILLLVPCTGLFWVDAVQGNHMFGFSNFEAVADVFFGKWIFLNITVPCCKVSRTRSTEGSEADDVEKWMLTVQLFRICVMMMNFLHTIRAVIMCESSFCMNKESVLKTCG